MPVCALAYLAMPFFFDAYALFEGFFYSNANRVTNSGSIEIMSIFWVVYTLVGVLFGYFFGSYFIDWKDTRGDLLGLEPYLITGLW